MNRRGFLQSILAAGVAPAITRYKWMMPVKSGGLILPGNGSILSGAIGAYEGIRIYSGPVPKTVDGIDGSLLAEIPIRDHNGGSGLVQATGVATYAVYGDRVLRIGYELNFNSTSLFAGSNLFISGIEKKGPPEGGP